MPSEIPSALALPVILALAAAVVALWRDGAVWRAMFFNQAKRTGQAAALPRKPSDPPPASLPPPDWEEKSSVTRLRDAAEMAALKEEIERYERDMRALEDRNTITPIDGRVFRRRLPSRPG